MLHELSCDGVNRSLLGMLNRAKWNVEQVELICTGNVAVSGTIKDLPVITALKEILGNSPFRSGSGAETFLRTIPDFMVTIAESKDIEVHIPLGHIIAVRKISDTATGKTL